MAFARKVASQDGTLDCVKFNPIDFVWPLFFGIIAMLLLFVFSHDILAFLGVAQPQFINALAINLPLVFIISMGMGILQGKEDFGKYSIMLIFQAFSRLFFVVMALLLNTGSDGIFLAIFVSNIITIISLIFICSKFDLIVEFKAGHFTAYPLLPIVVGLIVSMHTSIDVFWARHVLGTDMAGNFAATAILGKIILYGPMGIIFILFPRIVSLYRIGDPVNKLIVRAFCGAFLLSIILFLLVNFAVRSLFPFVFGNLFAINPGVLVIYSMAMLLLGLNYLLFSLFVALRVGSYSIWFGLGGFISAFVLLWSFGDSDITIAATLLVANMIVFLTSFWNLLKIITQRKV